MAKMKIYEIARSLQSQNKDIKSSDLVKLLNEHGYDAKGANSNIEDAAIAFLLRTFPSKGENKAVTNKDEMKKETKKDESLKKDMSLNQKDEQVTKQEIKQDTKQESKEENVRVERPVQNQMSQNQPRQNQPRQEGRNDYQNQNNFRQNQNSGNNNYVKRDNNRDDNRDNNNFRQNRNNGRYNNTNNNNNSNYNNNTNNTNNTNNNNSNSNYNNNNNSNYSNNNYNRDNNRNNNGSFSGNNRQGQGNGQRQDYRNNDNAGGNRQWNNNRPNNNSNYSNNNNRPNNNSNYSNNNNRPNNNSNYSNNNNRPNNNSNYSNNNNRPNNNSNYSNNNNRPNNNGNYNNNYNNNRPAGNRPNNQSGNYNNNNRFDNNNRKPSPDRVIEKFEKTQASFDGIKQETRNNRQRPNKNQVDPKNKYGKYRKDDTDGEFKFGKDGFGRPKKDPNRKGAFIKPEPIEKKQEEVVKEIKIPEVITIKELAEKMRLQPSAIVKKLLLQGKMVSINQEVSLEEAQEIALEYDIIAEIEEKVDVIAEILKEDEEEEKDMAKRPPVVCVMGHVDHGKTSLLDAIRETNVTSREAGGITQHIGAYVVEVNGEKITFLDTPGHEAFTSMRMRGAQSTDIAILVVAADDGVMPQTIEAINHAKAAGVEIIVAVNKIDKPGANVERVKQELVEYELIAEDWGGSTVFVPVSAHTHEGIDQLLEMILLTSEVLELKANPDRKARGIVIEAQLDKGRGPVATILVQKGTLEVGDHIAIGSSYGKVRAMVDHTGERVKEAGPSTPVEILGLNAVPDAGEIFVATESDKEAKNIAATYINKDKEKKVEETKSKKLSLDGLFSQIQAGNIKELNLIIKADVQGSVEAVKQSLVKLSNEEVAIRVIHGGVGAINESDVSLAAASNAIIIGFNIRPDNTAKEIAERENVDVRLYRIIYNAIEDIENAMKGMLDPIFEEKIIGHAEVRQTFKASGLGTIAGSYVLDGKIVRNCMVRITREGKLIYEGDLSSLKRFKDDVKEVATGYECGLVFEKFNDIQEADQVECYVMEEVPR